MISLHITLQTKHLVEGMLLVDLCFSVTSPSYLLRSESQHYKAQLLVVCLEQLSHAV